LNVPNDWPSTTRAVPTSSWNVAPPLVTRIESLDHTGPHSWSPAPNEIAAPPAVSSRLDQ
jgi:hypothetical protein